VSPPGPPPPRRSPPARMSDEEDVRHGKWRGFDRPSGMLSPISPQVLPPLAGLARRRAPPLVVGLQRERARALTKCHDMRVQTHRVGFYSRKLIEAITPKLAQSFRVEQAKNGEMTLTGTAKTAGLMRIQGRPLTRAGITPT